MYQETIIVQEQNNTVQLILSRTIHLVNLRSKECSIDCISHIFYSIIFLRCKEAKLRQETTSRILVNIKAGVEHLSDKLQYLKAPKTQVPQTNLNPTNEEYILDLLGKYVSTVEKYFNYSTDFSERPEFYSFHYFGFYLEDIWHPPAV